MKYRDSEGNLQEIYLPPTGDTLPIGSVIEYAGDTVPTNWELVEDTGTYKKIKKVANSVGLVANVTNEYSESKQESYDCDYVNKAITPKQNKEWVMLYKGKKKSDGFLSLPETFNELYVEVEIKTSESATGDIATFNIPKVCLEDTKKVFGNGFYFNNSVNAGTFVLISKTQIKLNDTYFASSYADSNANSLINVYYR